MSRRGLHAGAGMHTEHVPRPVVPPITDSHHAFVRRPRGEVGYHHCVTCGEGTKHPIHKTNPKRTGLSYSGRTTCIDCGAAIGRAALRCKPCNDKRIVAMADRRNTIDRAKRAAARREEPKYTRETK